MENLSVRWSAVGRTGRGEPVVGCITWLGVWAATGQALLPIAWPPAAVRHGHDKNEIRLDRVEYAIGESVGGTASHKLTPKPDRRDS